MSDSDFLFWMLMLVAAVVLAVLGALSRHEAKQMAASRARIERLMQECDAALQAELMARLTPPRPKWADVLGLDLPTTKDLVKQAYRALSRQHHPDAGGTHEVMQQLNEARTQALNSLKVAAAR